MKKTLILIFSMCISMIFTVNAQTSFSDNFNAGSIGTGWKSTSYYSFLQSGGVLQIKASTTTSGCAFTLDLGSNTDISSNAVVNLKVKAVRACNLRIGLVDASGAKLYKEVRIPVVSANFLNYCFDFTSGTIDRTKIKSMEFMTNPDAVSFSGTIYFDDLLVGGTAVKFAALSPVDDILLYKGRTAQKILITDIANASSITVSGGGA